MKTRIKFISLILILIFIFSAAGTLIIFRNSENSEVEIIQDGNVIYIFDLSDTPDQIIKIPSPDGKSSNTVCISDGKIFISEAECPDKTCVKSGFLKSEGLPLVCLPNKLIIKYKNS